MMHARRWLLMLRECSDMGPCAGLCLVLGDWHAARWSAVLPSIRQPGWGRQLGRGCLPRHQRQDASLGTLGIRARASFQLLEVWQSPRLVEERLGRPIEAEVREPALAGIG